MKNISVAIPAYNEAPNIRKVVREGLAYLKKFPKREILVVDDGSKDETPRILDELARKYKEVKVIHHPHNLGLGQALKTAYRNAKYEWIFYAPADGQIKISSLEKYLKYIDKADIVIGYHKKRADPFKRKIESALYHLLLRIFFGLDFKVSTSSKLYKKKVLDAITFEADSAFIEPEILFKAKNMGCRFAEVSIEHYPRVAGSAKGDTFAETLQILYDIIKLWLFLRVRRRERKLFKKLSLP